MKARNEPNAPYDHNRVKAIDWTDSALDSPNKAPFRTIVFIAPNPKFKKGQGRYGPERYTRAVTVRAYDLRGVTAYVWASTRDGSKHLSGKGNAGGSGYDLESSAIDDAFCAAGVQMLKHFGGCGEGPMRLAVAALAFKLGWKTGQVMVF
jgi:hypothetical protein